MSKVDRLSGQASRAFSLATGMTHWNVGWKSVGTAVIGSRMVQAADAVRAGKATKTQLRILSANGIEPWMAERIANQMDQFGDKNGQLWLPQGGQWTDEEAFQAMRRAMGREMDMMVVTPGQDVPLSFSSEAGKFFLQFKRFGFSAYERVLLAGLQRADADALAGAVMALALGGLVSNIKAYVGGYEQKTGAAYWEDALDRSGLMGWLMEPYNLVSAASGGKLSISGEPVSRFQSRSAGAGLLGPSVDMGIGVLEAMNAFSSDAASYRDARKIMRPIPGNNLWFMLGAMQKV
jgi:hypothetical protein